MSYRLHDRVAQPTVHEVAAAAALHEAASAVIERTRTARGLAGHVIDPTILAGVAALLSSAGPQPSSSPRVRRAGVSAPAGSQGAARSRRVMATSQ
jgi:hypothetical protein